MSDIIAYLMSELGYLVALEGFVIAMACAAVLGVIALFKYITHT